ncbi:hypothetical protein [Solitalea lacus]|uniref:hypothetical protein n=1 Tax=Solitalea lacus TaxID=2911172 RepID=UPI001EDAA764|nr:hypothetical protein [Solitalea lacus]UKJ08015.1 hypothetical protein L2B55_02325 [Solitalea lacus]
MKYLYISLLCCFSALKCFAQSDSTKTTFTLAAIYSTNSNYYGQTSESRLPYVLTNGTLRFPAGLYFSASAYKLLNTQESSTVSATALGAGFELNLGKNVTADLNYQHTFYPSTSPMLQAANNNIASASLTYAWWLSTGLSVDYAFGDQEDIFATFGVSKQISLGSFSDRDIITLSPGVEIVGGSRHYYNEYVVKKNKGLFGNILPGGFQDETVKEFSSNFDLMSYNLKLPLAYNRSHYIFEAAYQLSVLGKQPELTSTKTNSFLNLSFYYQF